MLRTKSSNLILKSLVITFEKLSNHQSDDNFSPTVIVVYIDTIKTTFDFNFGFLPWYTHKHGKKEKLSIKSLFLFTCKLVIQNLNRKAVFIVLIKTPNTVASPR